MVKTKKRLITWLLSLTFILTAACGAGGESAPATEASDTKADTITATETELTPATYETAEPDSYRNYYEIFVGSFYDSDGDGMGDLNGIIKKLDYLNDGTAGSKTSLHVDGIWLMPIMPSPSYHKYDVTDYYAIDPAYGSMEDFDRLIEECGKRGINVIIDLVMNHSSNRHPWFQSALDELKTGAEWNYANYYNITEEKLNSEYHTTGIPGFYYEGVFVNSMPDLNYDNEKVKKEFQDIAAFWLDKGVAGFRLDAIKHIFNETAKNVDFMKWFCDYCRSIKPDVYIVGEVWSTDNEIVAFYESGIDSLFNFTFAQADGLITAAVNYGVGADYAKNIVRWDKLITSKNPGAIDTVFLSNHDQNRSAAYFSQELSKEKMAAALYLLAPGNPFIYYGEEIGMTGNGIDENKRGPIVWSLSDKMGKTKGPQAMTERTKSKEGVEEQLADPSSLLSFYIEAINLKNRYPAISRGKPSELKNGDREIAAYIMTYKDESVAILHNLSSEPKDVTLTGYKASAGAGYLSAGGEAPAVNGDIVSMPSFSSAIVPVESDE